jgi:hypothetical protein
MGQALTNMNPRSSFLNLLFWRKPATSQPPSMMQPQFVSKPQVRDAGAIRKPTL